MKLFYFTTHQIDHLDDISITNGLKYISVLKINGEDLETVVTLESDSSENSKEAIEDWILECGQKIEDYQLIEL